MSEKTLPLPIEQAYAKLRDILLKNKCKIIEEKSPEHISVEQGSLSGVMPRSAKKIIKYHLTRESTGTKIVGSTNIASDWTYLTLVGNVLAAVLAGIFLWIAADLENFVQTNKPSSWSWLVRANMENAFFMVNVTRALTAFLAIMILVEILIVIYVYPRKNLFAQEMLQALS